MAIVPTVPLRSQGLELSAQSLVCMGMFAFYGPPKPDEEMSSWMSAFYGPPKPDEEMIELIHKAVIHKAVEHGGLELSAQSLVCMGMSAFYGPPKPDEEMSSWMSAFYGPPKPDEEMIELIHKAVEHGVSLSDLLIKLDISLDVQQSLELGPESYAAELQPFVDCEEHIQKSASYSHAKRKGPAPDIIDYLREGLKRTAYATKRKTLALPGIRKNNVASPKALPHPSFSEEPGAVQSPQPFGSTVC
ncbi:hypothetical protein R1sor_012872 [Riccia sorocarpa]|uniref:Uncharacterized protein n=1 Tax=Riccia sorocarpa TaxID=122646 RepID=A0ABD3I5L7_9MARC